MEKRQQEQHSSARREEERGRAGGGKAGDRAITLKELLRILNTSRLSTVSAETTLLSAIPKLREKGFDDVVLIDTSKSSARERYRPDRPVVISGYSIVSKLLETRPENYGHLLNSPCLDSSLVVGTVGEESDLLSIFHVYESTTFGIAIIHNSKDKEIVGRLTVRDLCRLYQSGVISASLVIDDVASSPIFNLPKNAGLRQTLKELETRKFRNVQVAGTDRIVSDKQILSHIFDEKRLDTISKTPERLLEGTLEEVHPASSLRIDGKRSVKDAAKLLGEREYECLLTERGIVTPWDLIIKPWRLGELRVSNESA